MIEKGNEILGVLGYTEHSKKHAAKVAETAAKILKDLGYGSHEMELAGSPAICTISATALTAMTTPTAGPYWPTRF